MLSLGGGDYPLKLKGLMAGAEEDPEQTSEVADAGNIPGFGL